MTAQAWFVDPQNLSGTANDANDGRSAQKALRTGKRLLDLLGRRYTVPRGTLVDVTFLSDMAASDRMSFEVTLDDPATAAFRLHGSLVPLFQGTVTSYTAETPSTNTKATLVATGVTSAHIGKLLYFPASNAWAIATACPSSGTLKLEPAKIYSSSDSTTITRATPANGATFIVYNKTKGYFGSLSFLAAWNVTDPPAPWPPPFVVENFDCPELVTFDGIGGAYQPTLIRQCTFADVITVASASNLFRACTFTANTGGTSNFAGTTQKPVAFSGCAFFGGDVAMSGARFGAGDHDSNAILCAWVVVDRSCRIKGQLDLSTHGFGEESGLWISQGVLAFTAADDVVYGTATGNNALVLADHASLRYPDGVQVYTTTDARQILVGGLGASTLLTPSLTSGSAASCDTWAKLLAAPFNGAAYNADELCFIRQTDAVVTTGARIALYGDVPGSLSASGGLVSAWGVAQAAGSARPQLTNDSVSNAALVRTKSGTKLTFPSGACDFASQAPATFVLAWRQRIYTGTGSYVLFDTTNNGATAGVQIVAIEPVSSLGRQLLARVFDGATWIIDRDLALPNQAYQALIWTVSVIVITSTSLTIYSDGYAWLEITFPAITFPVGAASPGVLGGSPDDWLAFEIWDSAFDATGVMAATARLRSRFALPYGIVRIFSDDKAGETQPSACLLSDGTYIAMATQNPGPGDEFTNGVIQMRTSPDGVTWTPDPGLTIPTANGLQLPFTPGAGVGLIEPTVMQCSNGVLLVTCSEGTASRVRLLRAASAAAARANTWTNEIVITQGTPILDDCASNITEDPANPGHVYCCVYRQLTGEAFSSACFYKSTNYGVDGFPTLVKFANGVTDSIDYQEPGLAFVPAAGAAKYSDLATGQFLFLVRDSGHATMWEFTATSAAGPWTRRATNIAAFQCARFQFMQDGTYLVLCRDATNGFGMIYRRKGVVSGTATYTANPEAVAPFPAWQTVSGSGNLGQGGNICKEVTAGVPLVVGATRLDLNRCDTYARLWPEKQLYGQMPIVVSPSSVASKNAGDTVQFTALGAGDFVWSLQTNASGGTIGSSTGLYTAGATTGTDIIRCTDLNGYFDGSKDVSISVTGSAPTSPWLLSSCLLWVEPSSILQSGGNLTSWQDKTNHANHLIQGGATAVPVSGSTVTTGGGAYLKSTNNVTLGRFTTVTKLATSAVGQIAYHDVGPGGGNYWYTLNPSAYIARSDGNQSLYSANFSTGVRSGSQVIAGLTFAGLAADAKLTLAGVDQTMTSATGDLATNPDTGKLYVGGDNTGGDNIAAAFKAFGVFDDTISPSELAAVYAYLATL